MYRKTYVEIDENILKKNVQEIINKYNNYDYYFGVVKNNAYAHGIKIVNSLIESGVNYLAVSSLEEALEIRKYNVEIPILCLEIVDIDYIYDCINNNVTITVDNLDYFKKINELKLDYELKVHIKINSGMNRLGFKENSKVKKVIDIANDNPKINIEGIYTHFATSGISDKEYDNQLNNFNKIISSIDLSKIKIVHLGRSMTLVNHDKLDFVNGIRLGIIMYGFSQSMKLDNSIKGKLRNIKRNYLINKYNISKTNLTNDLKLNTAFSLYSNVMSIQDVSEGEFVGYGAGYRVNKNEKVAIIPIGYADGVTKSFKNVYINNKRYTIISDSMDMIMVLIDKSVKIGDKVEIIGKNISVREVANNLGVNSYKVFNMIRNRVPRVHKKDNEEVEIKY